MSIETLKELLEINDRKTVIMNNKDMILQDMKLNSETREKLKQDLLSVQKERETLEKKGNNITSEQSVQISNLLKEEIDLEIAITKIENTLENLYVSKKLQEKELEEIEEQKKSIAEKEKNISQRRQQDKLSGKVILNKSIAAKYTFMDNSKNSICEIFGQNPIRAVKLPFMMNSQSTIQTSENFIDLINKSESINSTRLDLMSKKEIQEELRKQKMFESIKEDIEEYFKDDKKEENNNEVSLSPLVDIKEQQEMSNSDSEENTTEKEETDSNENIEEETENNNVIDTKVSDEAEKEETDSNENIEEETKDNNVIDTKVSDEAEKEETDSNEKIEEETEDNNVIDTKVSDEVEKEETDSNEKIEEKSEEKPSLFDINKEIVNTNAKSEEEKEDTNVSNEKVTINVDEETNSEEEKSSLFNINNDTNEEKNEVNNDTVDSSNSIPSFTDLVNNNDNNNKEATPEVSKENQSVDIPNFGLVNPIGVEPQVNNEPIVNISDISNDNTVETPISNNDSSSMTNLFSAAAEIPQGNNLFNTESAQSNDDFIQMGDKLLNKVATVLPKDVKLPNIKKNIPDPSQTLLCKRDENNKLVSFEIYNKDSENVNNLPNQTSNIFTSGEQNNVSNFNIFEQAENNMKMTA